MPQLSPEDWAEFIKLERNYQRGVCGYTTEHDAEHGVDGLLELAIDYARRERSLQSAALIQAARDLLGAE